MSESGPKIETHKKNTTKQAKTKVDRQNRKKYKMKKDRGIDRSKYVLRQLATIAIENPKKNMFLFVKYNLRSYNTFKTAAKEGCEGYNTSQILLIKVPFS